MVIKHYKIIINKSFFNNLIKTFQHKFPLKIFLAVEWFRPSKPYVESNEIVPYAYVVRTSRVATQNSRPWKTFPVGRRNIDY